MADESVFDLDDLVELVRHDAADLVNLKVAKAGGITPALELAARRAACTGSGSRVGCMLESARRRQRRRRSLAAGSAATSCPTWTARGGWPTGRRTPTG